LLRQEGQPTGFLSLSTHKIARPTCHSIYPPLREGDRSGLRRLHLLCPLLTSASRSGRLSTPSVLADTMQISRGKSDRLRITTAESTLRRLDGYGLRDVRLTRPRLAPPIRFLFIGSILCSTLLPDLPSRVTPLRFANPSPPSGWIEDSHLQAVKHARHTTQPLRGRRFAW
jgi:hypothetical protein